VKPKRLRNIHRRDDRRDRSWFVLIQRGSVVHKKSFADRVHGGKRKALQVAITYRDELLRRIRPPQKFHRSNVLSRTGIIGVELSRERLPNGTLFERYRAFLVDPDGSKRRRSFAVNKYGRQKALELAIEARRAAMERCTSGYEDLPRGVPRRRYGTGGVRPAASSTRPWCGTDSTAG